MVKFLFTSFPPIFLRLVAISAISEFSEVFMLTLKPMPITQKSISDPEISDSIRIPQSFLPSICISLGHFISALMSDICCDVSEAANAATIFR